MKVLHLISGGDTGGAKTHVHSLLRGLGDRIDVSMVCFMDGPFAREARELGIRVEIMEGRNVLRVVKLLEQKVRAEGTELIHCHGSRGNLMGWLLKRRTGLPVVTTVHSDYRLDYMGRPLARLTYGTANALALRKLDYYIGVSDAMADTLIDRGFPPQKVFAIYNGLDFTPRTPALDRRAYLASLGLDWGEDCVIAGIAARLNPVKDLPTLLRGFAKARGERPELRLLIAGEGAQRAELESLAAQLGLDGAVCFAGWVSDTDSFYNALDINTLTSLSETFSYSLTEGARFRLPTVSSRVGGVPYLIDHGVHGLLFEPGDADTLARHLSLLAGDPALRRRLGEALFLRARTDYSLEGTISRQVEIYETILRRQARPSGRDGVVICGAYGRGNAGDDAILEAVLAELRQIDPDLPVWVLSRSPKATRRVYRVNSVYTFNALRFRRYMKRAKLYLNGGGSLMQDVTSRRSLWFYLYTIAAARRLGCRVMMYGCGIGPVNRPSNRRRVGRVLSRNVDIITLRDAHSRRELDDMGVSGPEVILAADPTVILPAAPRSVANAILAAAGLDPEGRYLGLSVRPWPGFREKLDDFAAAADYAYEKYGLTPVFLPVEERLDAPASALLAERLRRAPYRILREHGSSARTISLFARMDVVVSMRLHALVFAAGHGVPLVGVAYDQKVSSFLDMVGQDLHLDLEDLTAPRLCALIDAAVGRIGNDGLLSAGVERLRELERGNSLCAARLLSETEGRT